MAETWKFNGTKVNLPQKVGEADSYEITWKSYLDDTYVESFTYLYYDDTAKYLAFGTAGFWNGANNTYASANILVLDTAPTGALLTFLQTYATKQLSLKQSVEQHITDAYTAIGNKSGTIPTQKNLANLAGAIGTISTGVDTSDGNIEPTTVLKGYKGYAKGVAVNGAIEMYDGTVEDVVSGGYTLTLSEPRIPSEYDANSYIKFNGLASTTDWDLHCWTDYGNYYIKDKSGNDVTVGTVFNNITSISFVCVNKNATFNVGVNDKWYYSFNEGQEYAVTSSGTLIIEMSSDY